LNRVRYRYRLLPHIIAARFDHWSRCSTDPAIRGDRSFHAFTVTVRRFTSSADRRIVADTLVYRAFSDAPGAGCGRGCRGLARLAGRPSGQRRGRRKAVGRAGRHGKRGPPTYRVSSARLPTHSRTRRRASLRGPRTYERLRRPTTHRVRQRRLPACGRRPVTGRARMRRLAAYGSLGRLTMA